MKATELMIGDWVLYDYEETLPCKIASIASQIAQDEWGQAYCTCIFPDGCMDVCEGTLNPIPLTPEILEKNGFIYEEIAQSGKMEEYYVNRENGEIQMLLGCFKGEPYVSIAGIYKKLDYVHQLQHIISFYGLEELANNFRVM